jgi:hypothetical protein
MAQNVYTMQFSQHLLQEFRFHKFSKAIPTPKYPRLQARLKTLGAASHVNYGQHYHWNMPRIATNVYTFPDPRQLVQEYRFPKISKPIPTSNPLITRATSKTQNPWRSYPCELVLVKKAGIVMLNPTELAGANWMASAVVCRHLNIALGGKKNFDQQLISQSWRRKRLQRANQICLSPQRS